MDGFLFLMEKRKNLYTSYKDRILISEKASREILIEDKNKK